MKIERISIDKIKPYENNAKLHPPEQIEQIKKSILEFGNNDPIAVDERGVIIEGYGRYQALKELDIEEAQVIRLSHLTTEQNKNQFNFIEECLEQVKNNKIRKFDGANESGNLLYEIVRQYLESV